MRRKESRVCVGSEKDGWGVGRARLALGGEERRTEQVWGGQCRAGEGGVMLYEYMNLA